MISVFARIVGMIGIAAALAGAISGTALAEPRKHVPAAPSASAPAPVAQVPAEIIVLHATNAAGAGGIDPRIGPMRQLQLPPFSAYNTYRLLARHALTLSASQPGTTALPNGRVIRTVLKALLPDAKYRVSASISRPRADADKEESFLRLLEVTAKSGETFFVAGQSFRGGMLVLGIRVGAPVQPPVAPPKP